MFTVADDAPTTPADQIETALKDPGFGRYFVDHCAQATWIPERGWGDYRLGAMGGITIHPGLAALHYGQEIFEGLKAYRHGDEIRLFRPRMNAARFAQSAKRMAMPPLDEDVFCEAVESLVAANHRWVPTSSGEQSLYIRPFMYASETLIGVRDAYEYTFMTIATPVGPYYGEPLRLWVSPDYARSMIGGTGAVKCGGNYAASLAAEAQAHDNGCGQVLWLDSATRTLVEEGGTMNFLVVTRDDELITPALTGTILPGITRDSLLKLATMHGLTPVERDLPFSELCQRIHDGSITEAMACGTAAVVSPVIGIRTPTLDLVIGDGDPGRRTRELRAHLTGIQYGTEDDVFGWIHPVTIPSI